MSAVVYTSIDEPLPTAAAAAAPVRTPPKAEPPSLGASASNDLQAGREDGGAALDAQFAQFRASAVADGGLLLAAAAGGHSPPTREDDEGVLASARLDEQFEMWAKSSANTPPTNPPCATPARAPAPTAWTAPHPNLLVNVISTPLPPSSRPAVRRSLLY